ncbi:MAG: universal stress protein [Lewinellaceae bacterium]|nr:universal stress protein [Phaeodactylibacter sp.]MCB0614030.1 universal stress protein [Phaeodactylibacter sp.]MCB9348034.1 universal stress protein [Lewinellaceae bacterium]
MRTVSEKSAAKDTSLQPFTVKEAIVGLALDQADEPLLKYLKFFKGPIPIEGLSFLHVIPNTRARLPLTVARGVEVGRGAEEEAVLALSEKVQEIMPDRAATDVQYFAEDGAPLEKLLSLANEKQADLLVIGKKADSLYHGILSKNLIRQARSNVLIVPENAAISLKTILVPVDFSENSVRALKAALSIKAQVGDTVKIYAINIYQRPNLMAYKLNMSPERFERNIQENHAKGFEKFMEEELPEYMNRVEPILIWNDMPDVAHHIMDKAREVGANLVVMGCKGHSRLELMLLGSTTETFLNINTSVPSLVVK